MKSSGRCTHRISTANECRQAFEQVGYTFTKPVPVDHDNATDYPSGCYFDGVPRFNPNFEDITQPCSPTSRCICKKSERRIAIPCSGWHVDADGNERAFTMARRGYGIGDCRELEFEYKTIKSQEDCQMAADALCLGDLLGVPSKVESDESFFLPQGCFIDDTFTDADPVTGKVDISADLSFNSRGQGNCAAQKTCICEIPLQNPSEADGGEQGDCYEVITNGTCSRDRGLFNIMAKEDCENGAYYKKLPVHKVSSNDPSAHANLPYGCFLQEDDPDNPRLRLNSGDEYVFKQARAECTATSPCVCKKVKHVECCCLIRLSSVYFFNCSIPYF